MLDYRKHTLTNGLTLITHPCDHTPMATVNLLYYVGARDEEPSRTGFAHLFEHLMFSGTEAIPDFDDAVSRLGGQSNAATNNDYTYYYITLPVQHLREALRLEADRMQHLDVKAEALAVQQRVVTEEYHQRYINQPYGDIPLHLRPLCYDAHPYRWPTIGADIRHVSEATLEDVRRFHRRFYRPSNAVLAVAAPLSHEAIYDLAAEAFGFADLPEPKLVREDWLQVKPDTFHLGRTLRVEAEVPAARVCLAWPIVGAADRLYRACDLLSDVLANGKSSRLYRRLVAEGDLFAEADAALNGEQGPNLFLVSGKLRPGADPQRAAALLREQVCALATTEPPTPDELEKVVGKYENTFLFSQYRPSDRASALCHYTAYGDTALVDDEPARYRAVGLDQLAEAARLFLTSGTENTLFYEPSQQA